MKNGHIFTKEALEEYANSPDKIQPSGRKNFSEVRLISLTRFEDGKVFIHDGHHRCAAILQGGRDHLHEQEYIITDMKYAQYDEINLDAGFVTPFVPTHEIRLSDFSEFKDQATGFSEPNDAVFYIRNHRHLYCKKREISTVKEITTEWGPRC